jgi:hypothetical protein
MAYPVGMGKPLASALSVTRIAAGNQRSGSLGLYARALAIDENPPNVAPSIVDNCDSHCCA